MTLSLPLTSPLRLLVVSVATAVGGALALGSGAAGSPTLLPPPAVLTAAQVALPERVLQEQELQEQERSGLTCATSLAGIPLCTHEPVAAAAETGPAATPRGGTLGCYGDGTSGPRVRVVYARPQSAPDRSAEAVPAIREWAAGISSQLDASARRTGGRRHVRFATTAGSGCTLLVAQAVLPDSAFASFRSTIDALQARGLQAPWSKYLVWSDGTGVCGMGTTYADDSPGLDNLNNSSLPGYARVDRRCWGKVETHELVHMLGGVQPSAPNGTAGYHCSDGWDALCYDDGSAGSRQRQVCSREPVQLLDCRNDDYFSTSAPRGSYLQTHWNVARSSFLAATVSDPVAASPGPAETAPSPAPAAGPSGSPSPTPSPAPSQKPSPDPVTTVRELLPLPTLAPVLVR